MMEKDRVVATRNRDKIRRWVEARGGYPALVEGSGLKDEADLLRIGYPGCSNDEKLRRINWEEFFEKLDEHNLVFFYTVNSESDHEDSPVEELISEGKS